MTRVGDEDRRSHPLATHERRDPADRLECRPTRVLAEDRLLGHAVLDRVALGTRGFGRTVALALATGDDQPWRDASVEQVDRVVEPGGEHRGWATVVLGGAHDDDRVRRLTLVAVPLLPDAIRRVPADRDAGDQPRDDQPGEQAHDGV